MWIVPLIVTAVIVLLFGVGASNALYAKKENPEKKPLANKENRVTNYTMLTKKEVAARLKVLSSSELPVIEDAMGAMCYKPAMPPQTAEYICPTCSNKTLYSRGEAQRVEWKLPSLRSAVAAINGLDIRLNESEFCRTCSPDVKEPKLYLEIYYKDEDKTNRTAVYSVDDIYLLKEFLSGSLVHSDSYDYKTPLKKNINRLQELLGVKAE